MTAAITAIDHYIESTEEQRRDLRRQQADAEQTIAQTATKIAELEQRTEELLQGRRILEERQQPTIAAQDDTPPRAAFPLNSAGGYRREPVDAALYEAWGLIANAGGGDWRTQDAEWTAAARRWRDRFIGGQRPGPSADATS
jgi:hypothetical protein